MSGKIIIFTEIIGNPFATCADESREGVYPIPY